MRPCPHTRALSINKGRSEQKVSSKTPKHQKCVCVYVCCASCAHFDDWRNLHQHLSMECICVCARACRVCLCGVFACDCINMVSEWWDVPSIHLFCWHLHLKRATIEERQIGKMQESEISSAVTRFCNIVGFCCTLFRVNTHSWVTCNSSLVPFWNHLLTRLRVSKYLREAVYEWSYGVSSCGCGCFVFLCACVFLYECMHVQETEKELIVPILLIYRPSREPVLFPPSAIWPGSDTARPRLHR